MRTFVICAVALALFTAGSAVAGPSARTQLTVTYWEDGSRTADRTVWTLQCQPVDGTLPRLAAACGRIATGGRTFFAPLKEGIVCTEIYGGPQVGLVVGTIDGRRVWAKFQRRDGCEIGRWKRVSPWLLPPGGVT
jgi:subtilisin inhibitor-like